MHKTFTVQASVETWAITIECVLGRLLLKSWKTPETLLNVYATKKHKNSRRDEVPKAPLKHLPSDRTQPSFINVASCAQRTR